MQYYITVSVLNVNIGNPSFLFNFPRKPNKGVSRVGHVWCMRMSTCYGCNMVSHLPLIYPRYPWKNFWPIFEKNFWTKYFSSVKSFLEDMHVHLVGPSATITIQSVKSLGTVTSERINFSGVWKSPTWSKPGPLPWLIPTNEGRSTTVGVEGLPTQGVRFISFVASNIKKFALSGKVLYDSHIDIEICVMN